MYAPIYPTQLYFSDLIIVEIDANETALLNRINGPLWYRGWTNPDEKKCRRIKQWLKAIGATRVIIGHNVDTVRS